MRIVLSMTLLTLAVSTLPGCTTVPLRSRVTTSPEPAETLFLQSFEELAKSDSSPALETLHQHFPKNDWTRKAQSLAELYSSNRQTNRRSRELKADLCACKAAKQRRQEQINQLKNDLQRMNELVIEMELRSK